MTTTLDRKKIGRNNKRRGARDEKDVAAILNATTDEDVERFKADTGGKVDVKHPYLAVQVKGGKTVTTVALREGFESAKVDSLKSKKLPCVVLVDRSGTRVKRYIVFDLAEWADWNGESKTLA